MESNANQESGLVGQPLQLRDYKRRQGQRTAANALGIGINESLFRKMLLNRDKGLTKLILNL